LESLHTRLKRETAAAHGSLEAYIASRRFLTGLTGYTVFLRASYAFQAEAEQVLTRSGANAIIPDWHLRHRAHLAKRDLETLDAAGAGQEPTPCGGLTKVTGVAGVLGVAYVIEGATLGGAVVLKTVAPLGVSPSRGGAFLASYGRDRSVMWQSFLATVGRWERLGVEPAEVVTAAIAAFDTAHQHFERAGSGMSERQQQSA
jgi:heme oxygenase (biliverdin-IX-beta and delta-forming)